MHNHTASARARAVGSMHTLARGDSFFVFFCATLHLPTTMPVPIIIDTDMSIDVDDVGALCVAHALEDRGEAKILAVVHGTGLAQGAGAISVINHYYGRDDIPIGAYRGTIGRPESTPGPDWTNHGAGWYVSSLLEKFSSPVRDASEVEPAVSVFRRALANAPGWRSVTVVAIGHATNLLDLLRSPPDAISNLRGVDLIKEKVKRVVWMGGSFWVKDRVEWNFAACGGPGNPNATKCGAYVDLARLTSSALREWPPDVPTIFISFDIGFWVRSGGILKSAAPTRSPCRQAYMDFCGGTGGGGGLPEWCDARGRNAWDLMAVVLAVRDTGRYYHLMPGANTMDEMSGRNTWQDDPNGPWTRNSFGHFQAWMPDNGIEYNATSDEIDELLSQLPKATPPPSPPQPPAKPPPPPPPPPRVPISEPPSPHVPPSPQPLPRSSPLQVPPAFVGSQGSASLAATAHKSAYAMPLSRTRPSPPTGTASGAPSAGASLNFVAFGLILVFCSVSIGFWWKKISGGSKDPSREKRRKKRTGKAVHDDDLVALRDDVPSPNDHAGSEPGRPASKGGSTFMKCSLLNGKAQQQDSSSKSKRKTDRAKSKRTSASSADAAAISLLHADMEREII